MTKCVFKYTYNNDNKKGKYPSPLYILPLRVISLSLSQTHTHSQTGCSTFLVEHKSESSCKREERNSLVKSNVIKIAYYPKMKLT